MDEKRSVIKMDFAWPYGQQARDGLVSRPCVVVGANDKGLFVSPVVTSQAEGDEGKYAVRLPQGIARSVGLKGAKAAWVRSDQLNFVERGSPAIHGVMLPDGRPSWGFGKIDEKLQSMIDEKRTEAGRDGAQSLRKVATSSLMGDAKDLAPKEAAARVEAVQKSPARPLIRNHSQDLRERPEDVVRRRAQSHVLEGEILPPETKAPVSRKTGRKMDLVL